MWWLSVVGWAFLFAAVLLYAWLSMAQDRYRSRIEQAKLLQIRVPKEPWYMKLDWKKHFRR